MDFNDTTEEAAFRSEAKAWLEANVPTREELAGLDEIQAAKLWQKRKYDAGWACIRWPEEYGGRGASAIEQVIWNQEEGQFAVPGSVFGIGQGMAAPTLMAWASEEHKREHLPPARVRRAHLVPVVQRAGGRFRPRGATHACRTRRGRMGYQRAEDLDVGAHYSDYGIIVLRTDPNVPKHKGLSYFFLDMKSPGIDIRPIKQISGGANFNEVYFTDVRVPDDQRLGAVGQGWQVAITTLMNERAAIGGGGGVGFKQVFDLARKLEIDGEPAIRDKNVRAKLATWYAQEAGLRFTGYRSMTALSRGATPGPENSIGKLVGASKTQDMASFAMDLLELSGAVSDPAFAEAHGAYQATFMGSPGGRIAGGSDEIMLNILSERVLGMPQDVRVDKGIPFNEVPTGR